MFICYAGHDATSKSQNFAWDSFIRRSIVTHYSNAENSCSSSVNYNSK